jgi:hypothetical protein
MERFLRMAALPSETEPVWERLLLDLIPGSGSEPAILALHRDVAFELDGGEEEPEGMGWTLRLPIDGVAGVQLEGRPGVMPADAEDAPELSLEDFARQAAALLAERHLLDLAPAAVEIFV